MTKQDSPETHIHGESAEAPDSRTFNLEMQSSTDDRLHVAHQSAQQVVDRIRSGYSLLDNADSATMSVSQHTATELAQESALHSTEPQVSVLNIGRMGGSNELADLVSSILSDRNMTTVEIATEPDSLRVSIVTFNQLHDQTRATLVEAMRQYGVDVDPDSITIEAAVEMPAPYIGVTDGSDDTDTAETPAA